MREEVEQLLPLIKSGKASEVVVQDITERIKAAIKADPSKGKELGELFGKIRQASKSRPEPTGITWVPTGKGSLGIGHKPGGKISFEGLKQEGVSVVLTLLQENEGAPLIGKQLEHAGMDWIWFPFSASNPLQGDDLVQVHNLFKKLSDLLNRESRIYIHCSAGIHRTGMITYGLLRFLGNDKQVAMKLLQSLREVTSSQVGEDRLVWGDQFARS